MFARTRLVAALALSTAIASASTSPSDTVVKHSWPQIPHGWEYHTTPDPDHTVSLQVGLKQDRVDELISALHEVSDPAHPRYGQHLLKEAVEELVAPSNKTISQVHEWLRTHNVLLDAVTYSPARDWLFLPPLPVSTVERMLSASFVSYRHISSGAFKTRTLSYSVPRHLEENIDIVHPTTVFDGMKDMRVTSRLSDDKIMAAASGPGTTVKGPAGQDIPASCNTTVTPTCLQALYMTEGYVPQAAEKGNRIGIAGYLKQFVNFADLQFRPDAVGANVTVMLVDGGLNDQSIAGTEVGTHLMSAPHTMKKYCAHQSG
ncbi:hypothetical protein EWM64_g908 [Hericium alpestre]|uniref:Peptidase S53 activation domain-containing protein n=1 Tax=Hericium alpestre TaxID=135208 RepID=A0A4Z0A9T1_9AGAM|nr:hypothetical protein EWM64_g908 [Hericium alpestre]